MAIMKTSRQDEGGSALVPYRFLDEMEGLFDDFFGPRHGWEKKGAAWGGSFAVDVEETPKSFTLRAELPGVKKEDVRVTFEEGLLTLSGEKRMEKSSEEGRFHRVERSYGAFRRVFSLPPGIQADEVQASFQDGVLTVTVPKPKGSGAKTIPVSTN